MTSNAVQRPQTSGALRVAAALARLRCSAFSTMSRHRLDRRALHPGPRRSQRDPRDFHHGLLAFRHAIVVCVLLSWLGCTSSRKPSSQAKGPQGPSLKQANDQRFKELLESLVSPDEFLSRPRPQRNYDVLLAKMPTLELDEAESLDSPPELTPIDELADLNLFTIEVDPHLKELISGDLLQTRYDIPVVLNNQVLRFLNHYQTRWRDIMERGLKRAGRYVDLFREIFKREGLPQDLVYVPHTESLFNPRAYSRARAKGIWQFIKWTGRKQGLRQDWWIDERSDIVKSTEAAARYLKELHEQFGDWYLALAAYNVGPARIQRNLNRYGSIDYWDMVKRRLLPRETRNYVPSILATVIIYRNPERYGFHAEADPRIQFETLSLDYQVDLGVVSESIGVPLAELENLNPELTYGVTPKDYSEYRLKVPPGKAELLKSRLATLPEEERLQLQHHRVRRGETLSVIASRYGVPLRAIAQTNRLRNIHRIKEGQDLIIPIGARAAIQRYYRRRGSRQRPRILTPTYVVRRGDTLGRIARFYGVTVEKLQKWNNLEPGTIIYPGQKLTARDSSVTHSGTNHLVRKGDSLGKIARRYGVTVKQLQRWNNLKPGTFIYPGQEVKILAAAPETNN